MLKLFRKKPKLQRELPLVLFYTFKTGEPIYTYRPEDWGRISSRYYRAITEAQNSLQTFALTKNEWESATLLLKQKGVEKLTSAQGMSLQLAYNSLVEHTLDVNSTMDWFLAKGSGIKNANETLLDMLYCMFYVLEDEKETGYSEAFSVKKIDLLNAEPPDVRDFFFTNLKQIMGNLFPTSREDTLQLILELEKMKERLMYLHTPTA